MNKRKIAGALPAILGCCYAVGCSGAASDNGVPFQAAGASAIGGAVATSGAGTSGTAFAGSGGAAGLVSTDGGGTAGAAGIGGRGTAGAATKTGGRGGSVGAAGGSAGATVPVAGAGDPASCPAAPADASNEAVQALATLNAVRVTAGSGCINEIAALNKSALNHCNYYATNSQNASCIADPHGEVSSCDGFTGASVGAREKAAGYSNLMGSSEVMAFYGNPTLAIPTWINSVWHRLPMLDPWTTDMGYGGATRCDVIDFGRGTTLPPATVVVVYPYDGQTGVPPSFDGSREGPTPPAPTTGWPSAIPISVHAQSISVTEHILTKDGDSTPIEHVWLDSKSTALDAGVRGYLLSAVFMYGNSPLAANTKYRVKITGTHNGGALNLEWTFTTGASNPWGF